MNFRRAISSGFANYANFYGRAAAPEFWFWILFATPDAAITEFVDAAGTQSTDSSARAFHLRDSP
jgi:uncharacterized membrane protein YhaH (DUF805 family)